MHAMRLPIDGKLLASFANASKATPFSLVKCMKPPCSAAILST